MSATEDESQSLDAGWDAVPDADVDQAWDSVPAPVSSDPLSSSSTSAPPSAPAATEEVDSGWDDIATEVPGADGKRRPHRQRRAKAPVAAPAKNPVLLPRPAAPSKKHQREHARQQRLYEAKVKQERKAERKAQRAAEAREQAAERLRQTEAAERARREARERERSQRSTAAAPKPASLQRKKTGGERAREFEARPPERAHVVPSRGRGTADRRLRAWIVVTVLVLVIAAVWFAVRK